MLKTKFDREMKILLKNLKKIPDDFWMRTSGDKYEVIWFMNRQKPTVEQNYSFDEERFGITKEGKIIYGFDSGCSCPSPWSAQDFGDENYDIRTYKEFVLEKTPEFDPDWEDECYDNLKDYMLVLKDDVTPAEVLTAKNAEVRRYLMKRVGYENVKKNAEVIHKDGTSELIQIGDERYVKVKDGSTEREYLLYVPEFLKTCKEAIAWTFNLRAEEYKPEIET